MKKILITVTALIFTTASAFAGVNVGISGAFTMLDTSGTQTLKSSGKKSSTSKEEDVIVPSIFIEFESEAGVAVGLDYVPLEAEMGSGTRTDDDEETSGNNKASAELSDHMTIYALLPLGNFYVKAGIARATVDTTETLATGTTYGNEDVDGRMIGFGLDRDLDNGLFFRAEATYTDYDSVKFSGSFNGNAAGDSAVRNVVDGDVDATALRISIGKSF